MMRTSISWRRIGAFLLRHLYEIRASVDRKADIFFFPTIDLLTFGFLTVYINNLNFQAGLAGAILGGIIFWTLVYNLQRDMSFSVLEDAWSRNLYNIFATPLKLAEMVIGIFVLSVLKAIITISLIAFLALGMFGFNLLAYGPIVFFYILNLFLFGWAFGFMTAGIIFRFGTKVQAVAWSLILLLYPVSGVFYPLSTLPDFLQNLAGFLPISYVFEGFRDLILSGYSPDGKVLTLILFLNIIYLTLGITLFVMGFRSAKKRGWFIHPT